MTNDEFAKLAREVINTKPKNNCPDCLTRVRTYLASTQEWQAEINKLRAEVGRLSELVRIRSFANNEMVSQLESEKAKSLKYREALEWYNRNYFHEDGETEVNRRFRLALESKDEQ